MAEKKKVPQVEIIDNPHAPDFFASWHHGLAFRHGNIHMTLATDRPNHSAPGAASNIVITGRLIMPAAGARDLAERLLEFLNQIEKGAPPDTTRTLQ